MGKVISIMADFGFGPYAWLKDEGEPFPYVGTNIADSVSGFRGIFPVSDKLHKNFATWVLQFEDEWRDPEFDWEAFHEKGCELACRFKKEIGHLATIYYAKPMEDPNHEENEITQI